MARIPLVQEDDPAVSPEAREFLARVQAGMGELFNGVRLLANNPVQGSAWIGFIRAVRYQGSLTREQTELAYMTASTVNRCHY